MGLRSEIPADVAAEVLFESDRTCCVCRTRGRPVQIHHIDEDPLNHSQENLAVLCFDCHRDTQLKGGFDRKLDTNQIILYRNDWYNHVRQRRAYVAYSSGSHLDHEPAKLEPGSAVQSMSMTNFINSLPDQVRAAYAQAQQGWDTGVTAEMMNASYKLIDNLQTFLVRLASFYPDGHFGESGVQEYFLEATRSRFAWHRAHLEPEGSGTGGTMVGPMASGKVIRDLEEMVVELVRSLTYQLQDFNFTAWRERWRGAA